MGNEVKEFFEKFKNDVAKMKEQAPDTVNGFAAMFSKIMKDGALSLREKELIALGIGVVQRCTPCIRLHVQKSLDAGATKEQILEAASVAVMMGGGPAYTHVPLVVETLEALQ
ncbi:MAG: carboxymuconolactone decarboxylase family protein [Phycisphaerae bacterium]